MAYSVGFSKTIVLRARRDTVLLVTCVTATTFALASVIHSHQPPQQSAAASVQEQWTGGLAAVAAPTAIVASREPLTSASLVVPSAALALPQVQERALVKLHGCDGSGCDVPTPVRRPIGSFQQAAASPDLTIVHRTETSTRHAKPSLISRLNPLKHLPDMKAIRRPFAVAGDTVSGWFRRF